jgi:DNA polymerase-3 subunit epsilon
MSAWHRGTLVAFDVESTGVDVTTDRIVTATVVVLNAADRSIREREWLIDPGVEIPIEASNIHGVTTEKARAEGRPPAECLTEIVGHLAPAWHAGQPVVIYNAPYDLSILDHELVRHGLQPIAAYGGPGLVVDPHTIDKRLDMYRKGKRTLSVTCGHYGIQFDNAHTATADAIATARLAFRLAEKYPDILQDRPLEQLQDDQARWFAEKAANLEHYFRTKGGQPDAVVDPSWPYRPAGAAVSREATV